MATIKLALSTWCHFLEGARVPFEVWTDQKKLESLKQTWKLGAKQIRWAAFFSKFQFTIHHLFGKTNFLADALSRLPQHDTQSLLLWIQCFQRLMGVLFLPASRRVRTDPTG